VIALKAPRPVTPEEAGERLADAERTLAEWTSAAEQKTRQADAAAAELAELQAQIGDTVLDAEDQEQVDQITAAVIRVRTDQEIAHKAAEAARARLDAARRDVLSARATAYRARAAALRGVVGGHRAETERLLAALREHEGVPYVPARGWRPVTAAIELAAADLVKAAGEVERLAAGGSADQVMRIANRRPVPAGEAEQKALARRAGPSELVA
jgi:hypothetical protein